MILHEKVVADLKTINKRNGTVFLLSALDELENAYLVVLNSVIKSLEGKLIGYAKIKPRAMEGDMAMLAEIHHKAAESNRNLKNHSVLP
ncbi:hypothetical protein [Sporolactobacillus terrae]|uniref:hypothetical protein n=1 Tax=Sporolactobacillus terrae TaxID=269673 RepID=UPI00048DDFA6|nr:hypothetical protein [Sporolactobacillus terrae]